MKPAQGSRRAAQETIGIDQLRRLAARTEAVREEERTRIAREVHDVAGASHAVRLFI